MGSNRKEIPIWVWLAAWAAVTYGGFQLVAHFVERIFT